jgi:hypothetical protein
MFAGKNVFPTHARILAGRELRKRGYQRDKLTPYKNAHLENNKSELELSQIVKIGIIIFAYGTPVIFIKQINKRENRKIDREIEERNEWIRILENEI